MFASSDTNHAVAKLRTGAVCLRLSVSGEPRGPLCGMGTCFECRMEIGGAAHERSCMTPVQPAPARPVPTSCDVLVVGAGPGGLAAAKAAASRGKRVVLLDDNGKLGGQIWREMAGLSGPGVEFVARATLLQPLNGECVQVLSDGRSSTLRYGHMILATGATELFLPFPGWTLPNVLGAGGLQSLVKQGLDVKGRRIAVAGSGPLLLAVAAYLRQRGAEVLFVLEQASAGRIARFAAGLVTKPGKLGQGLLLKARLLGVPFLTSSWVVSASGDDRVRSVRVRRKGKEQDVPCDYLACGFGLVPNVRLAALFGARIESGCVVVDHEQRTANPRVFCVGEATGIGGLDKALLEGQIAGAASAGDLDVARRLARQRERERGFVTELARAFALRDELRSLATEETIVCRCEDVRRGALTGCTSWRDAKLQTRCGMGACQGRVCGPAVAFLSGFAVGDARPPIFHAPLSALITTTS